MFLNKVKMMTSDSLSNFGALTARFRLTVRNLGRTFDKDLKLASVVQGSFYRLRLLTKVESFLNCPDLEKASHAFISSKLDYCNALYVGISQCFVRRL